MSHRVAMVAACPFPVPQGSQVLLRDTARGMADLGNEVHLVTYGHGAPSDNGLTGHSVFLHTSARLPAFLPGARKTDAGLSMVKPLLDLALIRTLGRVMCERDIDLVHAHNYEGLIVALCARGRKGPVLYHAHNAMADELPFFLPGGALIGRQLDRFLPKQADFVIAPHARLASYLEARGCARDRIAVIPPAVDAGLFAPASVGNALPPVVYAGNLDAYQNLGLLWRAMNRVRAEVFEARLVVATARPGTISGARTVAVTDLKSLKTVLEQDAVVVCPRVSWSGYPIKILNAMAAGKPVVACRSAAYPLTDGVDGLVAPDDDDAAFADAIVRLLRAPALRETVGQNARRTIIEKHNSALVSGAIQQLYERAVRC